MFIHVYKLLKAKRSQQVIRFIISGSERKTGGEGEVVR